MRSSNLFREILRRIEEHPLSDLDSIAQSLHYSKYHLHHIFSENAGISLHEYMLRRNLTRAARQLTDTRTDLIDIALTCGYESRQTFSNAFRDAYHCSPGKFRRNGHFYPLQPLTDAELLIFIQSFFRRFRKGPVKMNCQTGMTALMSAFGRAYHSENEKDPVFYDGHARSLFSDEEYSFVRKCLLNGKDFFASDLCAASEEEILRRIVNDAIAPTPVCRAAFCEDALATAEKTGTVQYVILGAGLDTFAFRNAQFLRKHVVYEVDLPSAQADKLRRIARAGWTLPQNLRFAGMDFSKDCLSDRLLAAGFSPDKKTFFSWLGVSYYLTPEQIGSVFSQLSSLCSDGSSLVFDYADQDLFDAPEQRVQNMIALACSCDEPMKSCFSRFELIKLLEQHDFLVYEELTPESIQTSIINPHVSSIKAFEHIHYILAVKKEKRPR